MERLKTISNSLCFANFSWESVSIAVEFLFVGGYFPMEMLRKSRKSWSDPLNGYFAEINHDCKYAINGLAYTASEQNERSGRYRLNAVPI